jgi:serine/threonine-protein kinase
MSMEYIQGSSLKDLLLRNKRPPIWVVETILYELLSALSHAHRNGVTHRDLKPANMMIDKDGRLRLLDFGIAHTETPLEIGKELTQTGCIIGTAAYMSPEQIMGEKVNYASDLFSVGIIASEMLIGENLFRGKDFEETRENILKMKFKLEVFPDDVPKPLRKFVLKLLNKRASKRPSSACDAANELADLMREYPRDMTPYIAEWADTVNEDQPVDTVISPKPQKTTFKYGIGFLLGVIVTAIASVAIHLAI